MFINTQYGVCGKIVQTCQKCSKEYPSISSLWYHYQRDHHHTAPINCNLCSFTTAKKHKYFNHVNTSHRNFVKNLWPSCTRCDKYFDHIVPLKHHYAHQHKLKMSKDTEAEILYQFLDMVQSQSEQHNKPMQKITSLQHNQPLQQNKYAADNPLQNNLSKILLGEQTLQSLQDQLPIQVGLPHQAQPPKQDISSYPGHDSELEFVETDNSLLMFENQEQTSNQKEPLEAAQFLKEKYLEAIPSFGQAEKNDSLIRFQPSKGQTGSNSKMLKIPREKQKIIYLQPVFQQTNKNKKQYNFKKQCDPIVKSQNENERTSVKLGTNQYEQTSTNKVACEFCSSFFARNLICKHINLQHLNEIKDIWPKCQICSAHLMSHKALAVHSWRVHKIKVPRQILMNPHQTSVIPKDMGTVNNIGFSRSILSVKSTPPKTSTRDKSPAQNRNVTISSVLKEDMLNNPIFKEEVKRLEIVSNQEEKKSSAMSNNPSNHDMEKHSKFQCKSCTKEFGDENAYNTHVNEMHKFMCKFCNQEFEKLMKVSEHYVKVHAPKNVNDLKLPLKQEKTQTNSFEMKDPNQSLKRINMQPNDEILIKKLKFDLVDNTELDSSKILTANEKYKTNCNMITQSITIRNIHASQSIHLPDDKESEESNFMKENSINKDEILSVVAHAKVEPELVIQSSSQYQIITPKTTSEQDSSDLSEQTTLILNKKEVNKSVNGLRKIRKITKSQHAIGQEAAENSSIILNSKELSTKVEKLTDGDEFKIFSPESQRKLKTRTCSSESDNIQKRNDLDSKTNFSPLANSEEKSCKIKKNATLNEFMKNITPESVRELRARKSSSESNCIPKVNNQNSKANSSQISNSKEKIDKLEQNTANKEYENIISSESTREITARKHSSENDNILKLKGQDSEKNYNQISSSSKSSGKLEKLFDNEEIKIKSTANIGWQQSQRQLKARQCASKTDNNLKRPRRKLNLISSITHPELGTPSEDSKSKTNVRQSRSSNNAGCPKSKQNLKTELPTNKETNELNQSLPNQKHGSEINLNKKIKLKLTEGLFGCKFCPTVLQQAALLEKHTLKNHKNQKIPFLQCTQCDIKFEAVFQSRQHTQIFHSKAQTRVLDLSSPKEKKEHTRENSYINSNRFFNSKKTSIDWKAFVIEPTADTIKCKLCVKEYNSKKSFKRHLQSIHFQEKMYCGICQKTFLSKSSLNRHNQTHLSEPQLGCSYCPRLFKNKYGLQYHLDKYHNIITESTKSSDNPEPLSDNSFIAQPYSPACQEEEAEEESFIEKMIFDNLDEMETEIDPDLSIQVLEDLVNESINSSTADQHISSLLSSLNIPESELEESFMESYVENPVSPGSNEHTELGEKTLESSRDYSVSIGKPLLYTFDPEQSTLDDILNNSLAIEADLINLSNSSIDSGFNQMVYEQGSKGSSNGESTIVYSKEEEELNKSLSNFLHTNRKFLDSLNQNSLLPNLWSHQ